MRPFANRKPWGVLAAWSLLCTGPWVPWAVGEEASSKEQVTVQKTAEGLHFKVPPDWPIEKRGGVMAPIPIEEYLARKFKALEAHLQTLEQRMNGLDVRLRVLEEEVKTQRQGLRSAEQPTQ